MRVAIIGAGIGGLAAASLLADQGHDITVFDRFDRPRPLGSGLVIQPVGQSVLAQIGALEHARSLGNPITRMLGLETATQRRVLDVRYDLADPATFGLALHRASLFEALWKAMQARGNITLMPSSHVVDIRQDDDTAEILLQDTATDDHRKNGPFELVVNASGAGSALSPVRCRPLPYGAIWGTVDWPQTDLPKSDLSQRYRQASHMLGVLPIGHMPHENGFKAAIFWSLPSSGHTAWQNAGTKAWVRQTTELWPAFAPFAEQITDPAQMTMATYRHGTLLRPYTNRLVHIGDAAHRASPQLGQGANMALLDAAALASALTTRPLSRALPAYARARRLHTGIYQFMSRAFTPMYQSDSRVLPLVRDRLLFPVSQIPPVPRLLTSLVCGTMVRPCGPL